MIELIKEISSLDLPEIEIYRTLKKSQRHRDEGLFVVEGDKVVNRFLQSDLRVVSILMVSDLLDFYYPIIEKRPEKINIYTTSASLLKNIVGYRYHQGIMAVGMIPQPRSLEQVLAVLTEPAIFVALDRLESAENTGVIVRNCAANGVQALIVGERSTDPFLRRAVRNSMGTLFKLPIIYSENLATTLAQLRDSHNFQIVAANPNAQSHSLFSVDLCKNCCIVLGNEGVGIAPDILNQCDIKVRIPMVSNVDSLNVACASAVILYEATRQRYNSGIFL
ncbi:MAG: RNA methyltransferase [Fibrobacter sp.]|nr:RNA methyltransferase [Fibrobacter sp.]